MELRPSLFWDTDIKNIDLQTHKRQVIERVLERGRIPEVRDLFAFYGKNVIAVVMLSARSLDKLTLSCSKFSRAIREMYGLRNNILCSIANVDHHLVETS